MTDTIDRRLSRFEHAMWRLSEAATFNFAIVTRVQGPLTESVLRAALQQVQAQHPLLRMRVEAANGELWFRSGGVPAPSLEVIDGAGGQWSPHAEDEINRPLDSAAGPLVRCRLVRHQANAHDVLLTFHHLIGDGMSGVFLARDLIGAANALLQGDQRVPPRLADYLPIDQRLPSHARGWRGAYRQWQRIARSVFDDLRGRRAASLGSAGEATSAARTTLLVAKRFDAAFLTALRERARQANATVHSAFSAAIMLTMAEEISPDTAANIKHRTPINVRDVLDPPAGEAVGMFASMLFVHRRVAGDDDFWQLAARVREQLTRSAQSGQAAINARIVPWLYRTLGGDRLSHPQLLAAWRKRAPSTTGLTNLGRLQIELPPGPLHAERMIFVASPGPLGDFTCTAASFGDWLHCNFMFVAPTFSRDRAERLAEQMVDRLHAAVFGSDRPARAPQPGQPTSASSSIRP